jgi:hypothetical protein
MKKVHGLNTESVVNKSCKKKKERKSKGIKNGVHTHTQVNHAQNGQLIRAVFFNQSVSRLSHYQPAPLHSFSSATQRHLLRYFFVTFEFVDFS